MQVVNRKSAHARKGCIHTYVLTYVRTYIHTGSRIHSFSTLKRSHLLYVAISNSPENFNRLYISMYRTCKGKPSASFSSSKTLKSQSSARSKHVRRPCNCIIFSEEVKSKGLDGDISVGRLTAGMARDSSVCIKEYMDVQVNTNMRTYTRKSRGMGLCELCVCTCIIWTCKRSCQACPCVAMATFHAMIRMDLHTRCELDSETVT